MALDFSLGISWQYGLLAVLSMLLFPFFRGRYAFFIAAAAYSLIDIVPALLGASGTVGLWTLTGALTWGAIGMLFTLQKPNGSPITFAKLGIASTLIFDFLTGVAATTLLYGVPLEETFIGQLPFTAKHLIGIFAVSIILAPLLFPSLYKSLLRTRLFFIKPSFA